MGLIFALSSLVIFVFLSSAIAAILFGAERGPKFIRAAAYLYSRPRSPFEWFGFAIACLIAASSQLAILALIDSHARVFGPGGVLVLEVQLMAAAIWIAYLTHLYRRSQFGHTRHDRE